MTTLGNCAYSSAFIVLVLWGGLIPCQASTASASAALLGGNDFPGAAELIKELQAQQMSASPSAVTSAPVEDKAATWAKDLDIYAAHSTDQSPEKAAEEWLDLLDRYEALEGKPISDPKLRQRIESSSTVFEALPGPDAWGELQRLVEQKKADPNLNARQTALLCLLVHTLNNQEEAQWNDIESLGGDLNADAQTPGHFTPSFPTGMLIFELGRSLSMVAEDGQAVESFWNKELDREAQTPGQPNQNSPLGEIELPDLVGLLGSEKAGVLLGRLLTSPEFTIRSIKGVESERLACQMASQSINDIVNPCWGLTHSLEAGKLYKALLKKFGPPKNDNEAVAYYVLGLVLQGQSDAAVAAAMTAPQIELDEALHQAVEKGWSVQVGDFLHALLTQSPQTDAWELYVEVAAQLGEASQALQFVEDTAARKDLTPDARRAVSGALYRALLANDQIDEGVAALREQIDSLRNAPEKPNVDNNPYNSMLAELVKRDLELARVGRLLKNQAWESEGLQDARRDAWPADKADESQIRLFTHARDEIVDYFLETHQDRDAAQLEIASIVEQVRCAQTLSSGQNSNDLFQHFNPYSYENRGVRESLVRLATAYYQANRWNDILQLLKNVPYWNAIDLVDIASDRASLYRYSTPTLSLMAARALAETGRLEEARSILDYDLQIDGGDDAAYALFLKIGHEDLASRLDQLFQQDQFQPRPLIWKAAFLLKQGHFKEAQEACDQAIAIDPSDGETGKGNRMRAYSVMADICRAQNDTTKAAAYGNIVEAIRLSEDADDYYDAGLLTRAVAMYQQALGRFSDAYCIQSRIARQLAALGRMDEASVHYRRAFELMPASFGRMESHCFGCERAFQGKTAGAIAEETFQDMLKKDPNNPKLYYLLGYLRMEEKRYSDALPNFEHAVELDPDYINAWKNIVEVGEYYQLPAKLHDAAVFNLLRLDPAGRHTYPDVRHVRDLAQLWKVIVEASKQVPPKPTTLFGLKASAQRWNEMIAEAQKTTHFNFLSLMQRQSEYSQWRMLGSPQEVIDQNELIQQILERLRNYGAWIRTEVASSFVSPAIKTSSSPTQPPSSVNSAGMAILTVEVLDQDGKPISGATVKPIGARTKEDPMAGYGWPQSATGDASVQAIKSV